MKIKEEKEDGSAGIKIELSNGIISVYHTEGNALLFRKKAIKGDWDNIWKAIKDEKEKSYV